MGVIDYVKKLTKVVSRAEHRPAILGMETIRGADIAKLPSLPPLTTRFFFQIYYMSDLLRTVIKALVDETTRNGILIEKKFAVKCNDCGAEYSTVVQQCSRCFSTNLRRPSLDEYMFLKKFIEDVNFNDQTLIEVVRQILVDLNVLDNAYMGVVKDYYFNGDGEVVAAEVKEVLRVNPETVEIIMDNSGRYANTEDGKVVMFCLEHRDKYRVVDREQVLEARCSICNKKMYPAYFRVRKGVYGSDYIYYTNGEILHIKKFTPGVGYGISPLLALWQKLLILIKQDLFIHTAYDLQRPPKGILVIRGNRDSVAKAWNRLMEEAKANPHMIYPLIVPPTFGIGGATQRGRVVEWVDLSWKPEDVTLTNYRDEVRRSVGAMYGVQPIFYAQSGSRGLANEGLQITVTNRAVKMEQMLINEKVLKWLVRQLGVEDWLLKLNPSETRDMLAQLEREDMRINLAEKMRKLGYGVKAVMTDDGIDFIYYEPSGAEVPSKVALLERTARGDVFMIPPKEEKSGGEGKRGRPKKPEKRTEGEPEHGRPRREEQRFEGEPTGVRQPKTSLKPDYETRVTVRETVEYGSSSDAVPEGKEERKKGRKRRKTGKKKKR